MPKHQPSPNDGEGNQLKHRRDLCESTASEKLESIIFQSIQCNRLCDEDAEQVVAICEEHPSLVTSRFHNRITPLAFLIIGGARLKVIKSFCEKFPQATKLKWSPSTTWTAAGLPLQTACRIGDLLASGIIPFLAETSPEAVNVDSIVSLCRNNRPLVDIVALVDAVVQCGGLQSQQDQEHVLNSAFESSNYQYTRQDILNYLIPNCPKLSKFPVYGLSYHFASHLDHCRTMARLLPQLVKLDVNINWKLHGEFSWQTFTEALQGSRQLETLSLELWSRKCQESHYTLSRPVPLWVWNPLYAAIGSIPTLKTLYLATVLGMADSVGGIAITKTVVKVLGRNRLESLTLNGFRADLDIIFVALKQSVHLQHIDIKGCVEQNHRQEILNHVKAENATLTRIGGDLLGPTKLTQLAPGVDRMEPIEEVGVQINYYCGLNKLGRGLARDAATSAEVLVGLLKEAMRGDWNASWAPKKLGNVFGLLRENPSIWCKN